jgi:hypothetical protein
MTAPEAAAGVTQGEAVSRLTEAATRKLGFRRTILGEDRVVVQRSDLTTVLARLAADAARVTTGEGVVQIGYALAEAAGRLVVATDGREDLRADRVAVLDQLKAWRDALAALPATTQGADVLGADAVENRPHLLAMAHINSVDDPICVVDERGNPHLRYSGGHVEEAFKAGMAKARALAAAPHEAGGGAGWVYHNEDTGEEYASNHPVESGEVPDATRIRRSTEMEDHLYAEYQRLSSAPSPTAPANDGLGVREAVQDKRKLAGVIACAMQPGRDLHLNPLYLGDPAWRIATAVQDHVFSDPRRGVEGES